VIERVKGWLEQAPLAPFVLPFMVVVPFYQGNRLRSPIDDSLPTLWVLLVFALLLVFIFRVILKDLRLAAIFAVIWTGFFTHGPTIADYVAEIGWKHWAAIAVLGLLAFDVGRRLPREEEKLSKAMLWTNVGALALTLPTTLLAVYQTVELEMGRPDPQDVFAQFEAEADEQSPDVWHIVMDRYANRAVFAEAYDFDNTPFLNALRARGFAVEDEAFSNYQITAQSLSSTLNADYLDRLIEMQGNDLDSVPQIEAVRASQASWFFANEDYELVFASTWADISHTHDLADRFVNPRPVSQVQRGILDQSLISRIGKLFSLPYVSGRLDQCYREPAKFAELRQIAGEPQRKYVFAHFLIPHPPYVLDKDGVCKSRQTEIEWTRKRNFIEQVEYSNTQLLALIDAILAGPRPATIILQGDEGPYPAQYAGDEQFRSTPLAPKLSWANVGPDLWREKTGILMAVRHAEGETDYAPATPINLYPLVLNRDFNGKLPVRPERNFIFRDVTKIHQWTDVTEQLRPSATEGQAAE